LPRFVFGLANDRCVGHLVAFRHADQPEALRGAASLADFDADHLPGVNGKVDSKATRRHWNRRPQADSGPIRARLHRRDVSGKSPFLAGHNICVPEPFSHPETRIHIAELRYAASATRRFMSSLSRLLSATVEKLLFHPMTILGAETIGERFRLLQIQGDAFKGVKWVPGQSVQIFLGNMTKRAYTPMNFDSHEGSADLLIYLHGNSPGSTWAASVQAGDPCQAMRPKDSLDFAKLDGQALFFGDETSVAALQTLYRHDDTAAARYVLEVNSPTQAELILQRLAIANVSLVQKRQDGSYLAEVVSKLTGYASVMQEPQWIFTGQARTIQSVRKSLKSAGVGMRTSKVKAYWSPGKTGMD
jgi:ferric-chelate reductase (NADPH)